MQHLPISAISAFTFLPRLRFNLFFWNACRMNAQRLAAASANRLSFVELVSCQASTAFLAAGWLLKCFHRSGVAPNDKATTTMYF